MKKYLLSIAISISFLAADAQVFFTEDFSSGIPGSWSNVDNSGNNILWQYTTTGAANPNPNVDSVLNPAGTSAANGYIIIDSDSAGQSVSEDAVLTTSAINCSGHSSVHLIFNEYYAQYLASTGTVAVSHDNVNWTNFHLSNAGLGLNQSTANPNHVEVDITSEAGNQSTVYIRFSYHGEWDYWWFIDDIQLAEPPAVDLAAINIDQLATAYTMIPFPQATDLAMGFILKNNGGTTASGGTALFEVINTTSSQTVFSESIPVPPVSAGTTQVLSPATAFTPSSAGLYKSRVTVTIAGDANSANDILESTPIALTDSVYARDNGSFDGVQGVGVGPGEDAITGQNFYVNNTDLLTSVTFYMGDGFGAAANGTPVYITVHPQLNSTTGPDSTVLAVTDTIVFTPGMIPTGGAYYTVQIQNGAVQLNPGLYYLGVHETDSILTLGYSNSVFTPGAVWVHWNTIPSPPAVNGWATAEDFSLFFAYMIRANFGTGTISVAEIENDLALDVYPNPSNDHIYLHLKNKKPGAVNAVRVYNITGQQVYSGEWKEGNTYKIAENNLTPGIYSVVVFSDGRRICRLVSIVE